MKTEVLRYAFILTWAHFFYTITPSFSINLQQTMPIRSGFKRPHPVSQSVSSGLRRDSAVESNTRVDSRGFRSSSINEADFNPCERPASHHSPRGVHLSFPPLVLAFAVVFGYFLSSKFPEVFHGCFRVVKEPTMKFGRGFSRIMPFIRAFLSRLFEFGRLADVTSGRNEFSWERVDTYVESNKCKPVCSGLG